MTKYKKKFPAPDIPGVFRQYHRTMAVAEKGERQAVKDIHSLQKKRRK